MVKGTTIRGYLNANSIEIKMHCGVFYSGTINALLLKQRLHRKKCVYCQKYPSDYNTKNISEYYSNQSFTKSHLYSDLDKKNREYKTNKERYLSGLQDTEKVLESL